MKNVTDKLAADFGLDREAVGYWNKLSDMRRRPYYYEAVVLVASRFVRFSSTSSVRFSPCRFGCDPPLLGPLAAMLHAMPPAALR